MKTLPCNNSRIEVIHSHQEPLFLANILVHFPSNIFSPGTLQKLVSRKWQKAIFMEWGKGGLTRVWYVLRINLSSAILIFLQRKSCRIIMEPLLQFTQLRNRPPGMLTTFLTEYSSMLLGRKQSFKNYR